MYFLLVFLMMSGFVQGMDSLEYNKLVASVCPDFETQRFSAECLGIVSDGLKKCPNHKVLERLNDYTFCLGLVKYINEKTNCSHEYIAMMLGKENRIGKMEELYYVQQVEKAKWSLFERSISAEDFIEEYKSKYNDFESERGNFSSRFDYDWIYSDYEKVISGTLLEIALKGRMELVLPLLKTKKFDINKLSSRGLLNLFLVEGHNRLYLLQHCEDIEINKKDNDGCTVLNRVTYLGTDLHRRGFDKCVDEITDLLRYGADPSICNNKGENAYDLVRKRRPELVSVLESGRAMYLQSLPNK